MAGSFAILTVCTANICRSPMMELLFRRHLGAPYFSLASAGVRGWDQAPMDDEAAGELRRLGGDASEFRSQPISKSLVESADLILTATRQHRSDLLSQSPGALRKSFTLLEFAGLVSMVESETFPGLVAAAARKRSQGPAEADIADPFRQGELVHAQVANRIDDAVRTIAGALSKVTEPKGGKHSA